MKKIFIMMIMAAIMVGCHKDNITGDTPPVQEGSAATYSGKLTLNVGQNVTKAFDENLNWTWKEGDVIIGYQNSGSKHLNKLTFKEGITFVCENFIYNTDDNADFYFFYPDVDKESTDYIFPIQDGTWQPVLLGVAKNTTLENIGDVEMTHLTSAIEFKLFRQDRTTPHNIKKATLSVSSADNPEKNINYGWKLGDESDEGYSFYSYGSEITIDMTDNPSNTVVFNVPKSEEGDIDIVNYDLTLTLETEEEVVIEKEFKLNTDKIGLQYLVAGNLYKFSVDAAKDIPAKLPKGSEFNVAIKNALGNCTKIEFVPNSNATSEHVINEKGVPIYFVQEGEILKIHTAAEKFRANNDCYKMFDGLNTIIDIKFGTASEFDASFVSSMGYMFSGCRKLSSLNLNIFPASPFMRASSIFDEVGMDRGDTDPTSIMVSSQAYQNITTNGIPNTNRLGVGNYKILPLIPSAS